jgi:hypothetical protein
VYDPFWSSVQSVPRPAGSLALINSVDKELGDLFSLHLGGSSWLEQERFWVKLPAGGICGTRLRFLAGYTPPPDIYEALPLGKYSVQAVYFDRFISPCPIRNTERPAGTPIPKEIDAKRVSVGLKAWSEEFPGKELIRSNVEHFELVGSGDGEN